MTGPQESGDMVPPALVAAIRRHPGFPAAMRESAAAIVAAHERNRLLNRLISDPGRAAFGLLVMHLHFHADETGAGLTPSRLMQVCEEAGVCSRRRAKALLLLLRWAGHLAPLRGAAGDNRRRPLAPTERMTGAYLSRWRRQLQIIAPMSPEAATLAGELDRPEVFARFGAVLGQPLRSGFRILDHCPALEPVAERDNGILLMLTLALSGGPDGPMPPEGALDVSTAGLARQARVSRSHAANVLREAEGLGLIERGTADGDAKGAISCRPLLAESLRGFFAATFAAMIAAAVRVAADAPRSRAGLRPAPDLAAGRFFPAPGARVRPSPSD